jgi:hypothetical protein
MTSRVNTASTHLHVSQQIAHRRYNGPRRYFRVFIHPDPESLASAAYRYNGVILEGALGCCQPAFVKPVEDRHYGGIVRLTAEHLTTEIVTHEFTHAALVIYRMDIQPYVYLGNGCRRNEELLTHIVGDLVSSASAVLHRARIW